MSKVKRGCAVAGCCRTHNAKGLCGVHYIRMKRFNSFTLPYRKTAIERLLSKIKLKEDTGCWEWQNYVDKAGYGRFKSKADFSTLAHRHSWALHFGVIPKGSFVCHTCDNRKCVNPKHFFLGGYKENAQDKAAKGRSTRGRSCHSNKLSHVEVFGVLNSTDSISNIARQYHVSRSSVYKIKQGRSWNWLTEIKHENYDHRDIYSSCSDSNSKKNSDS